MLRENLRSILLSLLAAAACVNWAPIPATAQILYGSITGTITDQSGAVVPSVSVSATNEATGLKRQTVSDSAGIYRVLDLPQGPYAIEVSATGFRPLRKTNCWW